MIIMAHPKRKVMAEALASKLNCSIVWDENNNEWDTGKRALQSQHRDNYAIVLQDDAVVGNNFIENVWAALENAPEQTCISFYTGTSRPFSASVTRAVNEARETGASWLSAPSLYWGVGIAIKTEYIEPMLEYVKDSILPYDQRIGSYFKHINKKVYYTFPSIVDHLDEQSLIKGVHDYPRVAHEYTDELVSFNNKVVSII